MDDNKTALNEWKRDDDFYKVTKITGLHVEQLFNIGKFCWFISSNWTCAIIFFFFFRFLCNGILFLEMRNSFSEKTDLFYLVYNWLQNRKQTERKNN